MKRGKGLPRSIRSILWSYDVDQLSLERDKEMIITRCLNYGTLKEVKWLFNTYGEDVIKKVVANPMRGRWWQRVLNFWLVILDIDLPEEIHDKAIIEIRPRFK